MQKNIDNTERPRLKDNYKTIVIHLNWMVAVYKSEITIFKYNSSKLTERFDFAQSRSWLVNAHWLSLNTKMEILYAQRPWYIYVCVLNK